MTKQNGNPEFNMKHKLPNCDVGKLCKVQVYGFEILLGGNELFLHMHSSSP